MLAKVESLAPFSPSNAPIPLPLRCQILPTTLWNKKALEDALGVTLPSDLEQLWDQASSLRLFEDVTYGQWGLVIWPPNQVIIEQGKRLSGRGQDFRGGDLVIGEFLGDSDLLMLRANPTERDFGHAMIALPLDPRKDWYVAAESLVTFLTRFLESNGNKFWEG